MCVSVCVCVCGAHHTEQRERKERKADRRMCKATASGIQAFFLILVLRFILFYFFLSLRRLLKREWMVPSCQVVHCGDVPSNTVACYIYGLFLKCF